MVEFAGRVQRIARVHQEGLRDKPSKYGTTIKYEKRPLLGFSNIEQREVEGFVINFINNI